MCFHDIGLCFEVSFVGIISVAQFGSVGECSEGYGVYLASFFTVGRDHAHFRKALIH